MMFVLSCVCVCVCARERERERASLLAVAPPPLGRAAARRSSLSIAATARLFLSLLHPSRLKQRKRPREVPRVLELARP